MIILYRACIIQLGELMWFLKIVHHRDALGLKKWFCRRILDISGQWLLSSWLIVYESKILGGGGGFVQFSYFMCLTYSHLASFRHLWHVQDGIRLFVSSCRCFWGGFKWLLNFFEVFVGGSTFQYYDDSPVNISLSSHLEFINSHWTWRIDDQMSRCN